MPKFTLGFPHNTKRRGARSQGLVEFALILPILLVVIFIIVELARLLHAWLAIENGARFGVRYAVTGEFDDAYCLALPGVCVPQSEQDLARISSIKDVTNVGAVAILKNTAVATVGQPGFFKITVCSNKPSVGYISSDPDTPTAASCVPQEDPGGPGDRVSVTIDFDHPVISPFISAVWPQLHLTARREGIVERYRTARVVGLPATISGPTPTPTLTLTPSLTYTPSATATATFTLTPTPTPDCSNIRMSGMTIRGDDLEADFRNDNDATAYIVNTFVDWPKLNGSMYLNKFELNDVEYWPGNDSNPSTDISSPIGTVPLPGGGNRDRWEGDFNGEPYEPIWGDYTLRVTFDFLDWDGDACVLTDSISRSQPPPPPTSTPRPPNTPGPSPTPKNTSKPSPSKTPVPTDPPGSTDTPKPPNPTNTPPFCTEC
ncbi:MAG: TadE/TadG family type IV pilus assembly protein [Anaerolineales bacterium]